MVTAVAVRPCHEWVPAEDAILRGEYGKPGTVLWLSKMLGVSKRAVYHRAQHLGLSRSNFTRWGTAEDDRLRELVGEYPVSKVAELMRTSRNRILSRMRRLNLSTKYRDGWYTLSDVVGILHVRSSKLVRYIESGKLVATWHHDRQPTQIGGKSYYHIREEDLRAFIIRYRFELDGSRVDLPTLVDILVDTNSLSQPH